MKPIDLKRSEICDWQDHYFPAGPGVDVSVDYSGRYYPAAPVEALVAAAGRMIEVGWTQRGWEDCLQRLEAALAPFTVSGGKA